MITMNQFNSNFCFSLNFFTVSSSQADYSFSQNQLVVLIGETGLAFCQSQNNIIIRYDTDRGCMCVYCCQLLFTNLEIKF